MSRITAVNPIAIAAVIEEGFAHHRAGRLAEAEAAYRRVLEVQAEHPDALHLLGVIARQVGNNEFAVDFIRRAIAANPRVASYHNTLGVALSDQGKLEDAVAAYHRALELKPDYAQAHNNLGIALSDQGKLEDAVAAYHRALELKPDYAQAHNNLGVALSDQGKLDEAISASRRALHLKPDDPEAHRNLGVALNRHGNREEAIASFEQALKINPLYAEAYCSLGTALDEQGKLGAAVACFRQALALEPNLAVAHCLMGAALTTEGKIDEAVARYQRALAIKPDFGVARYNLEFILKYLGMPEDAVVRCRRALAKRPNDAAAHLELGSALWQQGEVENAVAALCESLRIEPDRAAAHYHLGLARKTQGERGEALDCIRRALELDPGDVYALAAEASVLADEAASKKQHRRKNVKRVALHMNERFHYGILRGVFDACRERHISLLTPHVKELVDFDPDVVIVAESQAPLLRPRLPRALFVWVRHGLISKNTTCYAARVSDFACMTSDASRDWYIEHGGRPRCDFWITGYVQMDPLFRNDPLPMPFTLPADHRTVLYAPTWNAALSSAPMLGDRLVELIRGRRRDLSVVIKPHPGTREHRPEWIATWRALAEADADVHLVEDPATDVMPYLKAADLLISDVSGVIFEYLAVDRPIILITNPDRYTESHFLDPTGIEWRWRDVGDELHDVEGLPAAVDRALNDPRIGADRRAYYRRQLFGDLTDGRAAERLVEKVSELEL